VQRHASETYDVLGEGLLTESAGGRGAAPAFRFSRMGPEADGRLDARTTEILAANMAAGGGSGSEVSDIPAGYTYLGQFIAHDMSFDKTCVTLAQNVTPEWLLQGTSPTLDLDSLYGAGPDDPRSAGFYDDDGIHLRLGGTVPGVGGVQDDGFDLPRDAGSAVIADPRNDDNLAVAQTHLAFIRFHNRVADTLPASVPQGLRFRRARELATLHYQWMIRHDYLPRICAASVLDDVFANGRKAFEPGAAPTAFPTMPIEFSVGTFRLGHSMVRSVYSWNRRTPSRTLDHLFQFSGKGGDLGGKDRLPTSMIADFRRLYDFRDAGFADAVATFNRANRIDTRLVDPLKRLPPGTFDGQDVPPEDRRPELAFRNLIRAQMVKLASGPQMADFLIRCGVPLTKLTPAQILDDTKGAWLRGLLDPRKEELVAHTPLWFYILREAELNGGRLNDVGARIVAETFHRAMEGSNASIVRDPGWRPTLGSDGTTFCMVDLLLFACEGSLRLLAPLEPGD
jgi:Animal haem peroxidase